MPDGPEIHRLRVDRGLTTAQVAARVGLHPRTINAFEGQYRRISDVTASRLAKALSTPDDTVTVEDITDGDVSEPEPEALAS
jgi:transcriptional regulator with XRE-family HTH domain